jgi:hypothetical protein
VLSFIIYCIQKSNPIQQCLLSLITEMKDRLINITVDGNPGGSIGFWPNPFEGVLRAVRKSRGSLFFAFY